MLYEKTTAIKRYSNHFFNIGLFLSLTKQKVSMFSANIDYISPLARILSMLLSSQSQSFQFLNVELAWKAIFLVSLEIYQNKTNFNSYI